MQPLNIKNVQKAATNIAQFVQDEKLDLARKTIVSQIGAGKWPEEYRSYSGKITGKNSFDQPGRFFYVMRGSPHRYKERLTFLPLVEVNRDLIEQAAFEARKIVMQQAGLHRQTGRYQNTLQFDGGFTNPNDNIFYLYPTMEYGSKLEVDSLFGRQKYGGIFYFAAKKLRRFKRYKTLGISYTYWKADRLGLPFKWDVPVLMIGSKVDVEDELARPGARRKRRAASKRAKARRDARYEQRIRDIARGVF